MTDVMQRYEVVVGLEIHAQLSTASKIYSRDSAGFGGSPNTHVDVLTLGHPGTLPVLNEKVVDYAIRMGLATNCSIQLENQFARKNYFYADLPKGYQITQHTTPICENGFVDLKMDSGETRRIGITRIHMEEDAGKSMHDQDMHDSLIDLNRAGVPLIEIVSEPDIRSADEAGLYLTEVRKLLRYLEICDGNMDEGSMRCDANISVRLKGAVSLGNRCEVKNLNSIRNVQRAIEHEARRQVELIESGGHIDQNTLNFDALTGTTSVLRSKEMSNDYRYFPEPDLPPLQLDRAWIERVRGEMPELPEVLYDRYIKTYGLGEQDAATLIEHRDIAAWFVSVSKFSSHYKAIFNWLMGPIKNYLNEQAIEISALKLTPGQLAGIISLTADAKVNHTLAVQKLLPALLEDAGAEAGPVAEKLGILIQSDDSELQGFINQAISRFPDKVAEFQQGKKGLAGLFMGEVMKLSKGRVDPKTVNELLVHTLENYRP